MRYSFAIQRRRVAGLSGMATLRCTGANNRLARPWSYDITAASESDGLDTAACAST